MAMPTMSVPPPRRLRPTACSTFDANFLAIYNTFRTPFTLTSMTMRPSSWLSAVISKKTRGRPIFELLENWRMQHRNRFDIRTVKRRATDFRWLSIWQGCFGRKLFEQCRKYKQLCVPNSHLLYFGGLCLYLMILKSPKKLVAKI